MKRSGSGDGGGGVGSNCSGADCGGSEDGGMAMEAPRHCWKGRWSGGALCGAVDGGNELMEGRDDGVMSGVIVNHCAEVARRRRSSSHRFFGSDGGGCQGGGGNCGGGDD